MKRDYLLYSLKQIGNSLYGLEHIRYRKQLWVLCTVRKDHVCTITGKAIKKGEDAYRPITNAGNRYERICRALFEAGK